MIPFGSMNPPAAGGAWTPVGKPWLVAMYTADSGVLDGSDVAVVNGGAVSKWLDQSGAGRTAVVSATGSALPIYTASNTLANSRPTVGTTDNVVERGLETPSFTARAMYFVSGYRNGTETVFANGGTGEYPYPVSGPAANGLERFAGDINLSTWFTNLTLATTASRNGATATATALPLPISVLRIVFYANITQVWSLGFRKSILYRTWVGPTFGYAFTDNTESAADIERMFGYLAHKVGVQADLASATYRVNPP